MTIMRGGPDNVSGKIVMDNISRDVESTKGAIQGPIKSNGDNMVVGITDSLVPEYVGISNDFNYNAKVGAKK